MLASNRAECYLCPGVSPTTNQSNWQGAWGNAHYHKSLPGSIPLEANCAPTQLMPFTGALPGTSSLMASTLAMLGLSHPRSAPWSAAQHRPTIQALAVALILPLAAHKRSSSGSRGEPTHR